MLSNIRRPFKKNEDRRKSDYHKYKKKEYACFLCNSKSDDKGIPLLLSQTTFSRVCLGEKLQEILGDKFVLVITSKDAICWGCAKFINWVDRCERKLDVAKYNIINMVNTKSKNVEMNLEAVNPSLEEIHRLHSASSSTPAGEDRRNKLRYGDFNELSLVENIREDKKRQFECTICNKIFSTPAALGVHKARQHPPQRSCEYCGLVLPNEAKYKAHMSKHVARTLPASDKLLNCVSCGFQTKNMEVYCRHVCDSKIVSLVCSACRKRYIHKSGRISGKNLCGDCLADEDDNGQKENELAPALIETPKTDSMINNGKMHEIDLAMEVEEIDSDPLPILKNTIIDNGEESVSFQTPENAGEIVQHHVVEETENLSEMILENDNGLEDPTCEPHQSDGTQNENISTDLHNEMPEFFRAPQEKRVLDKDPTDDGSLSGVVINDNEMVLPMDESSLLKCTNCDEQFEVSQLATHACFLTGEIAELSAIESDSTYLRVPIYSDSQHEEQMSPVNGVELISRSNKRSGTRRRIPKIPAQENSHFSQLAEPETRMHCKTCYAEFRTIGLMRHHWDLTGHSREVSTTTIELNKIKDKNNKTEQTFKVVKQNFSIRANVIGQNEEDIRRNDEAFSDCIIKVKETPSIEEFMLRKDGKMCETCGVIFGDAELLAEHQCSNCLTCITCHITFIDNKLLKKHYLYTGHATKIFKKSESVEEIQTEHQVIDSYCCPKCNKTFLARLALSKHLKTHYKGTNRGACQYCLLEFDDKTMIQHHVLEAHGAYLYKCDHCDRAFLTKTGRNKHQIKHIIHVCTVCQVKFANQRLLLVHMDKVHRSKACRICGKMITDIYALRRHERRHFYDSGLKCDFCDITLRNKVALRTHNALHSNLPQFKCKTCNLGFKTPRNLEDHEITHIKKQYICGKCSVVCPSRNFYWMHMKLHESAYKCTVCSRMFRDTSLLAIHKRKHFRARPYQCPRCPRVFSVPATLKRHLSSHAKTYTFKCSLCKKGFLTKQAHLKHMESAHPAPTPSPQPPRRVINRIPALPLNATDEDILQAADNLISDDAIMFNDYHHKEGPIVQVPSSHMITEEIVVETTELFDEILQ